MNSVHAALIVDAVAVLKLTRPWATSSRDDYGPLIRITLSSTCKMPADTMASKEQYMMEMERRWKMAEKMMVDNPKKGWDNHGMLMKAIKELGPTHGGGAP